MCGGGQTVAPIHAMAGALLQSAVPDEEHHTHLIHERAAEMSRVPSLRLVTYDSRLGRPLIELASRY
jgi:hypothetical protein